jgi:hypothetical protein
VFRIHYLVSAGKALLGSRPRRSAEPREALTDADRTF